MGETISVKSNGKTVYEYETDAVNIYCRIVIAVFFFVRSAVYTRYGYEYGGKTYITKSASENETTYYSYVNDRLTSHKARPSR